MEAISEYQITETLAKYPGTPNVVQNLEHKRQWAIWRIILDRIVSNPHYRHDDSLRFPLLKMACFAAAMMAHYNTLTYGGVL